MVMERLRSLRDFENLQTAILSENDPSIPTIVIPAGTCGKASGAQRLIRTAQREILGRHLQSRLRLKVTGCHGFCQLEPSALIQPQAVFYPKISGKDMVRIIDAVLKNETVEELLYADPDTGLKFEKQEDIPFYRYQKRSLIALNERIDPLVLQDYMAIGGYGAFVRLLAEGNPEQILDEVKKSRLRGRGGAGFPTGVKWELLARQPNGHGKFLVCNGDEGDPGAYMDRSVLEGNPHSIIEGMLIGACATRADRGVIYVRSEYPMAIKHLKNAVRQCERLGLLGDNILGSDFNFRIELVKGAGAFVCGEETALIRSIEGKMGEPRQRPPFPIQKGIDGKPTLINNVETWANIPVIFREGVDAFMDVGGAHADTGTKIFSLVGKIRNTGLIEAPMGMPINDIIYAIGGGQSGKGRIKAVQTGGPSGGCIPSDLFDTPIGYESLAGVGSIMGSGGMIVMDENTCMVDVAKYFMNFLEKESCGKCLICRKGIQRMRELLEDISLGNGREQDLDLLEELALAVKDASMCGLGQTAPNPVLSTLRHFRSEYLEHIRNSRCPAGICKALISYCINEDCTGCGACVKACPEKAVSGKKNRKHVIDNVRCTKCGACISMCPSEAIDVKQYRDRRGA